MPRLIRFAYTILVLLSIILLAACGGNDTNTAQPEVTEQDTAQPEVIEQDTAQPEVTEQDTAQPEIIEQATAQPEVTEQEATVSSDAPPDETGPTATITPLVELPPTWTPEPSSTPFTPPPTVVITKRPTRVPFYPPTLTPQGGAASNPPAVPVSTNTPTVTPTAIHSDLTPITAANAAQLTEIGHLDDVFVADVTWSPDGRVLAVAMNDGVRLFDNADFESVPRWLEDERKSESSESFTTEAISFSPDGRYIASTNTDGELNIWENSADYQKLFMKKASEGTLWDVIFSPDSTRIATGDDLGMIKVWDMGTEELLHELDSNSGAVYDLAVYPISAFVAVSGVRTSQAKIWNLANGTELATISGHSVEARAVAFSPNGETLATGGNEGSVRIWTVAGAQNKTPEAILDGHGNNITCIVYSPDSKLLAVGVSTGSLHIWDLTTYQQLFQIDAHSPWINGIAWSADDTTIITTGNDNTVRVWGIPIDN